MLIGQGVHPLQQEQMRSWLEARPEIARVFNLITLQLGSDVMVSVKAQMREAQDAGALLAQINAVEAALRSAEHTSELQSLMRISYAVFCLKKKRQSILPN